MSNKITIKRSAVPGKVPVPGDLEYGEFAINYADGNLFFKDSSNSIATLASTQFVAVTGNVTGNYFIGNGALLTGISGASGMLVGTVDDFTGDGSTVSFTLSVTPTSENVTSVNISGVGQLKTAYSITNDVITFSSAPAAGAAIEVTTLSGSVMSVGNIANGTSTVAIPVENGNVIMTVGSSSNVFVVTDSGANTTGSLSATGNITGNYFIGNGSQLTGLPEGYGNADVAAYLPTYNGNIAVDNFTISGNTTGNLLPSANVTYNLGSSNQRWNDLWLSNSTIYLGNAQISANSTSITITNPQGGQTVLSGSSTEIAANAISVTGNIDAGNINGNGSGLTGITGGNVTGQVGNALVSGTVYTAAQPNITSVGTLSSLVVSGNITGGNLITAGSTNTGTLQTSGNAIIGGNLVVNGNTVNVNITDLNVQDPIIGLGRGANNAPLTTNDGKDRGTEMWYYTSSEQAAFVGYQNSTGNIIAASNISVTNEIVTVNSYGNFVAGNVIGATVSASGNITGSYFVGNGSQLTGLPESGLSWTTQANTAPANAAPGDFWYDSVAQVKYQYINDGTSNVWVDQSYPTTFSTISVLNIQNGGANGTGNIGTSSGTFNTVFAKATSAQYADLAEIYTADQDYQPGTVVVFGGTHEITVTDRSHDTRVAGVVSQNPAFLMNSHCDGLPVAFTGRVPCRVRGPVAKGDVLVTASEPGVAQRIEHDYRPGSVLGKSLGTISDSSVCVIEVVVGRF